MDFVFFTDRLVELALGLDSKDELQSVENEDGLRLLTRNIFGYINTFLTYNTKSQTDLKKCSPFRNRRLNRIDTNNSYTWLEEEIDQFVNAISSSCIRNWSEYICDIKSADSYSQKVSLSPKKYIWFDKVPDDEDFARDIEEELRYLLSSLLFKMRSMDKMTLMNDILSITRCHLKRVNKIINYRGRSNICDQGAVNGEKDDACFRFRHHIRTRKLAKNKERLKRGKRNELSSNVEMNNYLEKAAMNLITCHGRKENDRSLKTCFIQRLLNQLIGHQVFLNVIDVISDPNYMKEFLLKHLFQESIPKNSNSEHVYSMDNPESTKASTKNFNDSLISKPTFYGSQMSQNSDESMVQNSDIRYAESINLTGYVIENESMEESGTHSDIDKQNNHRGTGKISQALGKLFERYLRFDIIHQ